MKSALPSLIQDYYALFNARRFEEMAALFTLDAVVEHLPFQRQQMGPEGSAEFARSWIAAFPDAVLTVEGVTSRDPVTHETSLVAAGTHRGPLALGGWVFKPTGTYATLRLRELLQLRDGRIAFASLSFDLQEIVEQLVTVDCTQLLEHLDRLRQLGDSLAAATHDAIRARELIDRIGIELDAARHSVRPYFKR